MHWAARCDIVMSGVKRTWMPTAWRTTPWIRGQESGNRLTCVVYLLGMTHSKLIRDLAVQWIATRQRSASLFMLVFGLFFSIGLMPLQAAHATASENVTGWLWN